MNMRRCWLMLAQAAWIGAAAHAAEIRYSDVLYLDDMELPPLELKALNRTPLLFSRDNSSVIAHIAKGQLVTIMGVSATKYFVDCRISTGPARGWIDAGALEKPAEDVLEQLKERRKRMLANRELITRHEIAVGMRRAEVVASIGKPDRKSQLRTKEATQEEWFYFTYRYVPRYSYLIDPETGKLKPYVTYQRVVAGSKVVSFQGGEVVSIADEADDADGQPNPVVAPPVPSKVY